MLTRKKLRFKQKKNLLVEYGSRNSNECNASLFVEGKTRVKFDVFSIISNHLDASGLEFFGEVCLDVMVDSFGEIALEFRFDELANCVQAVTLSVLQL